MKGHTEVCPFIFCLKATIQISIPAPTRARQPQNSMWSYGVYYTHHNRYYYITSAQICRNKKAEKISALLDYQSSIINHQLSIIIYQSSQALQ